MHSVKKCGLISKILCVVVVMFIGNCGYCATVPCLENGRFYRNPDVTSSEVSAEDECAKYFLCLEGEVFEFRCTSGLLFDVNRQICDREPNVDNCDLLTEPVIPKPTENFECQESFLSCTNGTCLPNDYFCDGFQDCSDGSDELDCDLINDKFLAKPCEKNCKLPDCFCSNDGTKIPGDLKVEDIPQIILITFEGPINYDNFDLYTKTLFNQDILNPNGCPIKATFFVNHLYNNYHQTQLLWNGGHEIALHSITHRGPEIWWSENATVIDYFDEMIGQANILHKFGNIRMADILGVRVPHLKIGGNRQFLMMKEFGLLYDNSIVAPLQDPPLWPYTLDYKISHNCSDDQNCPSRPFPGVWEIAINTLIFNKFTCTTINDCAKDLSTEEIYKVLMHNFKRHYLTNRAPYGLHFKSDWFKNQENLEAFQKFVENMMLYQDVWFLTNSQALEWIQNPVPLAELKTLDLWNCDGQLKRSEIACEKSNVCKIYSSVFQQQRLMYTCADCPEVYPWLRNEFGKKEST